MKIYWECGHTANVINHMGWASLGAINFLQEQAQDSEVFEAVRTLSCMYLRADVQGFTDCIEAFELDSFLATKVLEYDVSNGLLCFMFHSISVHIYMDRRYLVPIYVCLDCILLTKVHVENI